jgi:transposase InsO family protein
MNANRHVDVSLLNLGGTFYYLCTVLDGYSRLITHWEIRQQMTETDVETILQRGLEKFRSSPRSGRGLSATTARSLSRGTSRSSSAWRASPTCARALIIRRAMARMERWYGSLKGERFRLAAPANVDEARQLVVRFVEHYNQVRLHSALGYIAPADQLAGRAQAIFDKRDRKLEEARARRAALAQAARQVA